MAHLVHPSPQFGFLPTPVNHSPSPLGFGFGLSSASMAAYAPQTQSPQPYPQPQSQHQQQQRSVQKRRHDEGDDELRDESMDRSPTPERRPMKRIAPKRMRVTPGTAPNDAGGVGDKPSKESRNSSAEVEDDVDVGMLLASLPPDSLLPLLTSLLTAHPTLKPTILSLIPRPTLDTAINALAQSAKKLRDAYPYSTIPTFSQTTSSTTFGFGGGGFGGSRANLTASAGSSPLGFGRSSPAANPSTQAAGMRDSYVVSRLRPHITEFVSASFSYLPYFSYLPSSSSSHFPNAGKDKPLAHPSETFAYLSSLTSHLISQPPLTQASLGPMLLPRLLPEWMAWIDRVDAHLNKEGGMFGQEVAQGWARALDQFAEAKISGISDGTEAGLRTVRDKWVARVGWLVGRREVQAMEEEDEL